LRGGGDRLAPRHRQPHGDAGTFAAFAELQQALPGLLRTECPRPALSRLLDEVEAAVNEDPSRYPTTTDEEFRRRL